MIQFLVDAKHQGEYNIERLVLTELSRVRNEAKRQSYERAGYASYKVLCVSDPCDTCQKHDREIYKLEGMTQGENAPTFHPNCRCTIVSAGLSDDEDDELEKLTERYYEEEKRLAEESKAKATIIGLTEPEQKAYASPAFIEHAYSKHISAYGNISEAEFAKYAEDLAHEESDLFERYCRKTGMLYNIKNLRMAI